MLISDLDYTHGIQFCGEYRIRRPSRKISGNGAPFYDVRIEDMSGDLQGYIWEERLSVPFPWHDLDSAGITGKIKRFNDGWLANITTINTINDHSIQPVRLIPASICPRPELLEQLSELVDSICADAASALRHLWSWRKGERRGRHPLLVAVNAISAADRISSALSVEEAAFRGRPSWQSFTRYDEQSAFWRPQLQPCEAVTA